MIDDFLRLKIKAFWRPRIESPESFVERELRLLKAISAFDPGYADWYDKGRSIKDALKRKIVESGQLLPGAKEVLLNQAYKSQKSYFPLYGISGSLWNGQKDEIESADFEIYASGRTIHNTFTLTFPQCKMRRTDHFSADRLISLIRDIVGSLDPDWVALEHFMRDAPRIRDDNYGPRAGWIMYHNMPVSRLENLGLPGKLFGMGQGICIVADERPLTPTVPEELEILQKITDIFEGSGICEYMRQILTTPCQ